MKRKKIVLLICVFTTLFFCMESFAFETVVGKWKRGNGYIWIYDSGFVKASYDNNKNRSWQYAGDNKYNYIGPSGEKLVISLIKNGTALSFSNGHVWNKVDTVESIVGKWKRNNGYIWIYDSGFVKASYDNNKNRSWQYAGNNKYSYIGPSGEKLVISLIKNGTALSFSNGQVWNRVN